MIPAYEWTILFAGLSAAFGMIALNGMPQTYHPLFNAPNFRNGATTDKFFLCIEAHDPQFSLGETRAFLEQFRRGLRGGGRPLMRQGSGMMTKCLAFTAALGCVTLLAGCRQDMHNQPKFYPQRGTDLLCRWPLGAPAGGEHGGAWPGRSEQLLPYRHDQRRRGQRDAVPGQRWMWWHRGQEKYNVYCTPCHSRVGNGAGMIVERGYAKACRQLPHGHACENAPLGHFFNVISNGYGAMPDYSAQMTPEDRWAIVSYIKALQLSQSAQPSDVAPGEHVQPLEEITKDSGFAPGFAAEWALPSTAVDGTPKRAATTLCIQQGQIGHATAPIGKAWEDQGRPGRRPARAIRFRSTTRSDPNGVKNSAPE